MDLAQILTQLSSFAANAGGARDAAAAEVQQKQQVQQQSIDALKEIGDLQVEANRMDAQQKLKMEDRKAAVSSAFNVDMTDPNNRIAYLARQQADEIDASLARSRRASELLDTNIFEDPLSYMVERPFAFRHQQAAEAHKGRAQLLDKAIDDLNTQAQQSVLTQKAINQEFTIDEAENQARLVKLQAEEAIRAAQINKSNTYIQDLKTLQGFDKTQLDAHAEAYKLRRHEQEFQMRMEEMRANREARMKSKQTEAEALTYAFEKYNLGAAMMGKAKVGNLAEFQMLFKKNQKLVQDIIQRGETVYVGLSEAGKPEVVDGRIARTPGEVIAALKQTHGNISPSAEKLSATMSDQYTVAVQELRNSGLTKITEDDVAAQVNRQLLGWTETLSKGKTRVHEGLIKQMAMNAEQDFGGSKNIFKAPAPTVIGQVVPALMQEKGWNEIVAKATLSNPNPTAKDMLAHSQMAVMEGKLSVEQAAGFVASYYKAAQQANAVNERYSRYAIPEDYNKNYNVVLPKVGKVDATNETQLKHAMLANFATRVR